MKPVKAVESEHVKSLVPEKSLKRQLPLDSDDSQEQEDLKYQLDGFCH